MSGKIGKLGLGFGYYSFGNVGSTLVSSGSIVNYEDDINIWQITANYSFDKNFNLAATYLKGKDDYDGLNVDDDGFIVKAPYKGAKASKPGSWGIVAKYYDEGTTTYMDHDMIG